VEYKVSSIGSSSVQTVQGEMKASNCTGEAERADRHRRGRQLGSWEPKCLFVHCRLTSGEEVAA
jgi:hypothetical protein